MVRTVGSMREQQAGEDDGEVEDAPKRLRLKVVASVVLVIVALAGAAVYWFALGGSPDQDGVVADGPIVTMDTMTVNLAGSSLSYARVGLAAVLAEGADVGPVEQRVPLLKDAAITELGGLTGEELRTPEGQSVLRERLTEHAAEIYPDDDVLRVVITELVVQ